MEENILEKLSVPENASPAAQAVVLAELLESVKELRKQSALFQNDLETLRAEPVVNPYETGTRIEEVIEGETATGEWVRIGKVWKDPEGYIRNQNEYEQYMAKEPSTMALESTESPETGETSPTENFINE